MAWVFAVGWILLGIAGGALAVFNRYAAIACGALWLILGIAGLIVFRRYRRFVAATVRDAEDTLDMSREDSLFAFPMPVVLLSAENEVLGYNTRFRTLILEGEDAYGVKADTVFPDFSSDDLDRRDTVDLRRGDLHLTAYVGKPASGEGHVLYLADDTSLKNIAAEYTASRPVAMFLRIDNLDEATHDRRESDRMLVSSQVEMMLEDWIDSTDGILRKYTQNRFLAIVENRHLEQQTRERFPILDRVREAFSDYDPGITLSIGVGRGKTLAECVQTARLSLDMALGRGGDQAAVKTADGYDFYGGTTRGVERRTKVKTRSTAHTLKELIQSGDRVLVMGHRYSDLDALGSAIALAAVARALGKPAYVVVQRHATMAAELMEAYTQNGQSDIFLEPEEAMGLVTDTTLLIVTDVHAADRVESPALYEKAQRVVVIDHHRLMVDHIENAVLNDHEPSASSASELVAELLPYMGDDLIGKAEAEALLAGIILDTQSFVLRTGVRTFESAAYLRQRGADTVAVKRLFSGDMSVYRKKSELVGSAVQVGRIAIVTTEEDLTEQRAAASQAADEMLSIRGVDAAFVICYMGKEVNISARSYGNMNVQLIMEQMGGGGHLTMAATQIKNTTVAEAEARLRQVVEEYEINNQN